LTIATATGNAYFKKFWCKINALIGLPYELSQITHGNLDIIDIKIF
jgi:hypothetical protein